MKDYDFNPYAAGMVTFTRRTNYPKLGWLITKLEEAGIACALDGQSFHAPILKVYPDDLKKAWAVIDPVDEIEDDDEMFAGYDNVEPDTPDGTPIMER